MKAHEYLARQHAENWSDPPPPEAAQDALAHAYRVGFERSRSMAVGLLRDLGGLNNQQLAILIGAIGTAEVDPETGKPWFDDEPTDSQGGLTDGA